MSIPAERICRNCHSNLEFEAGETVLHCPHCLAVYPKTPNHFPAPSNLIVDQSIEGELRLDYAWQRPGAKAAVAFTVIWMAMLILITTLGWQSLNERFASIFPQWAFAIPLVVLSGALVWSLFALYSALAGWFNTTTFMLQRSSIKIWSHPLPVRGTIQLPVALRDTFTRKVVVPLKKGELVTYQVEAIFENEKTHVLFKDLDHAEEAFGIEQVLESFINDSKQA